MTRTSGEKSRTGCYAVAVNQKFIIALYFSGGFFIKILCPVFVMNHKLSVVNELKFEYYFHRLLKIYILKRKRPLRLSWSMLTRYSLTSSFWKCF